MHLPDAGTSDNVLELAKEDLSKRKVIPLDIADGIKPDEPQYDVSLSSRCECCSRQARRCRAVQIVGHRDMACNQHTRRALLANTQVKYDATLYRSERTNRGPLQLGWAARLPADQPIMCCYKVVRVSSPSFPSNFVAFKLP